jgi:hypothetical protein
MPLKLNYIYMGVGIMRYITITAAAVFAFVAYSNVANAWDAANCRAKCRATATSPAGVDTCIAKWNCDSLAGKHESNKSVDAGVKAWKGANPR